MVQWTYNNTIGTSVRGIRWAREFCCVVLLGCFSLSLWERKRMTNGLDFARIPVVADFVSWCYVYAVE